MTDPVRTIAAVLASVGNGIYEPTDADLELPAAELAARIRERERAVIERNNRASVHYWERATHLLNKERFRSCR
jgi:hypothetical protein